MACFRKPHWPTLLALLGLIWIIATFLTSAGIYMVICHSQATTQKVQVLEQKSYDVMCGDWLTWRTGQWMLIAGCLFNGMLLAVMILFLMMERRHQPRSLLQQQEEPPAYEMVIKEETPPPSFSELGLVSSATSLSSLSLSDWTPTPQLTLLPAATTV